MSATEVAVLPLVDRPRPGMPGWCTSGVDLEDSPDVEVMCGGINSKTPAHAAVWRQGNLLHFGFEETPSEFNASGRALLENAIAYIARFTEDRPIAVTPAGFGNKVTPRTRRALHQALANPEATVKDLARNLSPGVRDDILAMPVAAAKAWVQENLAFLASDASGFLAVDPDAKALNLVVDAPDFLAAAKTGAADEPPWNRLRALFARRIPDGPGPEASREAWTAFLDENRAFLFYSEPGGHRWYLDPLARKRQIPSAELRGPRRGS